LVKGITNRQIFFTLLLVLCAFRTIDIPQIAAKTMGRSGWIVIAAYAVPFSLVAVMITKLNNMFMGMTLFEYGQILLGKVLNYFLCILFAVYFFTVLAYLNESMVELISANFLPRTEPAFTLAIAMALFGFIVYRGTETMARLFELLGVMYLAVTLLLCLLMLTQSEIVNILPLYNPNDVSQLWSALLLFGTLFGGVENLLLIPFDQKNKKAPKAAFFSIVVIAVLFVLITEGSIGMLGINNAIAYSDPFIEAVKLADAPVIERPDILYITFGLASLFAILTILIRSVAEILSKMIPSAKRGLLISVVCAASYIASLVLLGMPAYNEEFKRILPMLVLIFAGLLPTLLFLLAVIKKRSGLKR
jgi:spore germination protein